LQQHRAAAAAATSLTDIISSFPIRDPDPVIIERAKQPDLPPPTVALRHRKRFALFNASGIILLPSFATGVIVGLCFIHAQQETLYSRFELHTTPHRSAGAAAIVSCRIHSVVMVDIVVDINV
jgi:hypothetical protein